jgi:phosphatidylglycerophosphate synthase
MDIERANYLRWEQGMYLRFRRMRDFLVVPIVEVLVRVGASADMITYLGGILMATTLWTVAANRVLAAWTVVSAFVSDSLDGAVARRLGTQSDKGKFKDVVLDSVTWTLFMVGIDVAKLGSTSIIALSIYFMLLFKSLTILNRAQKYESDWKFHPVAGFTAVMASYIVYVAFLIQVFLGIAILSQTIWVSFLIAVCGSIYQYRVAILHDVTIRK